MPNRLLDIIRRAALLRDGGGLSDRELLALFVMHRDGDAFAALLNRHGPMVMGVCRRILLNRHDAEDAFQATFLIFARKADSVHAQQSIAGWLYRVAYRTALQARARLARRRVKEQQVEDLPHPQIEPEDGNSEWLALLDKELNRLPDKYRIPVILCELEGRSRREVARFLSLPEGTLSWRLAQAKKILAKRLSRRGVTLTVGALAIATEVLSPTLRASTVQAALTAGAVPANVLVLTEGVLKAMFLSKLKITICFAAMALVAGIGASGLSYRATAQQPRQETAIASRPQADELEALRLEIEALRKSLQATRERVKLLEGEVIALKGRTDATTGRRGSGPPPGVKGGMPGAAPGGGMGGSSASAGAQPTVRSAASGSAGVPQGQPGMPGTQQGGPPGGGAGRFKSSNTPAGRTGSGDMRPGGKMSKTPAGNMMEMRPGQGMMRKGTSDPLSDAEAALKKLRTNPGDKEATEELERALKRLKEREKSRTLGR